MLISDYQERQSQIEAKRRKILRFLRDETWSNADVLQNLMGYTSRQAIHQTLVKLERDKYIKRQSLSFERHTVTIWGITPHGLAFGFDQGERYEERPYFEPGRISLSRIPHQIDLQKARLIAESKGWTDWTRGERLGFKVDMRPDAIVTRPDGVTVAIELERIIKTAKRYQQIIKNHLDQINANAWRGVYYLTANGIHSRLERVFDAVQYIIVQGQRKPLTDDLRKRFRFYELESWGS